jgi:argininosuccinate lyase
MPQKKNPDFAEVTIGRAAAAQGYVQALLSLQGGLPSGYHRALQWTKHLAMEAADNAAGAGIVFAEVFENLAVNADAMRAACSGGFINATDVADEIGRRLRIPFREAYKAVGAAVKACEAEGRLTLEAVNAELAARGHAPLPAEAWPRLHEPDAMLLQRDQAGNPAPARTEAMIATLRADAARHATRVDAFLARWAEADRRLWKELGSLAAAPQ